MVRVRQLELIKRGSTLIADDVVEVSNHQDRVLSGTAPEMLRYYMEVRGIGIIDVRTLYGAKAVKQSVEVDMVIKLENWDETSPYDRLGWMRRHRIFLESRCRW